MNTVFTNISGRGEILLALHGWGMNHRVWQPIRESLEQIFTVVWVDLPGHGQSKSLALGDNIDESVDQIFPILSRFSQEKPVHILGWSLGGLLAQRLAERYPERVCSLLLVATTPSFLQRKGWHNAMTPTALDNFVESLEKDFVLTIKRFLSLQFMGVKGVQTDIKKLRQEILSSPPQTQALSDGLTILKQTDLREAKVSCPQHWMLGELDKLVPISVVTDLARKDQRSFKVIPGAGHAPFISHPDEFVGSIRDFFING